MTELKPCPLCGSTHLTSGYMIDGNFDDSKKLLREHTGFGVFCQHCQLLMSQSWDYTWEMKEIYKDQFRKDAERKTDWVIDGWNMRYDYRKEIKRCSDCLYGVRDTDDYGNPIICKHNLDFRQSDCDDYIGREVE